MSSQGTTLPAPPLALPAPSDVNVQVPEPEVEKITVNGAQTFKFDKLGPIVVNKDGTLSRIANWEEMTHIEKERTVRILVVRNQIRLTNQEVRQGDASEEQLSISKGLDV